VSDKAFAIQKFQVVLPESFRASEESVFGRRKTVWFIQLRAGEFKCAGDVRNLEETVLRWFDFGNELRAGGKDGECLLEKGGQVVLSVVVVDLQLVKGGEFVRMIHEKPDNLLKKRIVETLLSADEILVDLEAGVRDVGVVQEQKHAAEDSAPFLASHVGIFGFAANQGAGMNTMTSVESDGSKRVLEGFDFMLDLDGLIVKDHADHIVARGQAIRVEASRFVNEYADLFCGCHGVQFSRITKARIAPRLRQESFPRAGDLGFRPCRRILNHNLWLDARG